jgi:hypothetical protein
MYLTLLHMTHEKLGKRVRGENTEERFQHSISGHRTENAAIIVGIPVDCHEVAVGSDKDIEIFWMSTLVDGVSGLIHKPDPLSLVLNRIPEIVWMIVVVLLSQLVVCKAGTTWILILILHVFLSFAKIIRRKVCFQYKPMRSGKEYQELVKLWSRRRGALFKNIRYLQ